MRSAQARSRIEAARGNRFMGVPDIRRGAGEERVEIGESEEAETKTGEWAFP